MRQRANAKTWVTRAGVVAAVCAALFALANPRPVAALETTPGETLHQACSGAAPGVCLAYVAGVMDLHEEAIAPRMGRMFCPPERVDFTVIGSHIERWFNENAAAKELPAVYGVAKALGELFPCE